MIVQIRFYLENALSSWKNVLCRFYVFWCGWFQVNIVEIKITIITITFGITSTTTAPPVVSYLLSEGQ